MLQPSRTKFRKQMKGRNKGLAYTGSSVAFGEYGLKVGEGGIANITARQLEAARRVISRYVKQTGKLWIRGFPDKPISKKPLEVRMGSGKGSVEYWVFPVQPGRVLFEVEGIDEVTARMAFKKASAKLPVKTIFVKRELMG